jgi:cardiolipin synthase
VESTGASPSNRTDDRVVALAEELSGVPATTGNQVELLVEDRDAFARIEHELARARHSIWAEYYIVRNDETGHRFLDLLAARARAGVSVLLLYDGFGSLGLDAERLRAIRAAGGRVEPFLPVNPLRRRWAVHLRNHRKLIVIDGAIAFTGGMNMGDEYSGRSRLKGKQYFRDSHLRIEGPAVRYFAEIFAGDWDFAAGEQLVCGTAVAAAGTALVCPVPSGPDQRWNASAHVFFAGIMSARESCFLTTPYFLPDESTQTALVTAAKSGVDVRLLLPKRCDVPVVGSAARSYYRELIRAGVRVFEFRPAMLHAKSLSVDGRWGIVGSANINMRSFRLNFEISALVHDERFAGQLTSRFMDELDQSDEITVDSLARVGLARHLFQSTARLMSPLL